MWLLKMHFQYYNTRCYILMQVHSSFIFYNESVSGWFLYNSEFEVDNVVTKRSVSSQSQLKVLHHFSVYLFMPYDDLYGSKHVAFYVVHTKIVGLFNIAFIIHCTWDCQ